MMARRVQADIKRINNYEKLWKIKTNTNKFKIIPLASYKTEPIIVDDIHIPYSKDGTILGLKINSTGILGQVAHSRNKALQALTTLKRFTLLPSKIKAHLIKAYIIPILTYPAYPLAALSRQSIYKLQTVQNKALRFTYDDKYPYTHTNRELHHKAKIQPININIYHRGKATMNTLITTTNDPTYNSILENSNNQEHSWFKKPHLPLTNPEPVPLYTNH